MVVVNCVFTSYYNYISIEEGIPNNFQLSIAVLTVKHVFNFGTEKVSKGPPSKMYSHRSLHANAEINVWSIYAWT